MLFGFIIAQFYSGSIVSSLLDWKHESIKTLNDLLKSNLNLALENVPYDIYIFNVSSYILEYSTHLHRISRFFKFNFRQQKILY